MTEIIVMLEFKTVCSGMVAINDILNGSNTDIVDSLTVCPGKYIAIVKGLENEIQKGLSQVDLSNDDIIGHITIEHNSDKIFSAIMGCGKVQNMRSLILIETYDASSAIKASNILLENSNLELIEIKMARGMCGKSVVIATGDFSELEIKKEQVMESLKESQMLISACIIEKPNPKFVARLA